jgi:hypothetical protein
MNASGPCNIQVIYNYYMEFEEKYYEPENIGSF